MSTLNGQNNEHDQELLHAIEQIVQQEANTPHDPHSPLGVGARLAGTVAQLDTAFADRLEARLVAAAEQCKEETMKPIASQRPLTDRRVGTSGKRHAPHSTARIAAVCLAALVLVVGLVATAPPVRAAVESVIERFGLVGVDPNAPTPEPAEGVIGEAQPVPEAVALQLLSLEKAQKQVPFPIRLPTWLPEGLALQGVVVGQGGWG